MSSHPYPGPGSSWPAAKRTMKGLRNQRYERLQCEACDAWISRNAMGRHMQTHGQHPARVPVRIPGTYVPEGHRRCGIDGCQRILPREAPRCYQHSDRDDDLLELDRLCAMGVTRPRGRM
jgi:hypothetical protein